MAIDALVADNCINGTYLDTLLRNISTGNSDEGFRMYLSLKKRNRRGLKQRIRRVNAHLSGNDFEALVRYAWEHVWKQKYDIPELVSGKDIARTIGTGAYGALGLTPGNPAELLFRCIPGYGIADDEKIAIFIDAHVTTEKQTLRHAFLEEMDSKVDPHYEARTKSNAKKMVGYLIAHSGNKALPELTSEKDILKSLGCAVYSPFGIMPGNSHLLFKECIADYGILTEEKANAFVANYRELHPHTRKKLDTLFFTGEYAERNARVFVKSYQGHGTNLSETDMSKLPAYAMQLLSIACVTN